MCKLAIYSCYVLLVTFVVVLSSSMPCKPRQPCLSSNGPVCGRDGITYHSLCYLKSKTCGSVRVAYEGACVKTKSNVSCRPKHCPFTYHPVCGSDGRTYGSRCIMESETCGKIKVAYLGKCQSATDAGPCPKFRPCFNNYRPVCGSDGVTYPNLCFMESLKCGKNVRAVSEGECPQI